MFELSMHEVLQVSGGIVDDIIGGTQGYGTLGGGGTDNGFSGGSGGCSSSLLWPYFSFQAC